MDLEKIEGLVKIIEDSSLNEFTYKDKDVKITMSKLDHPPVVAAGVPVASSAPVNSAAAPDVPAFVKVGDHVKAGQTVCILEAMKLMNEIQSDYDCEIEAVLVSNEQKVEYGQPLFRVKRL